MSLLSDRTTPRNLGDPAREIPTKKDPTENGRALDRSPEGTGGVKEGWPHFAPLASPEVEWLEWCCNRCEIWREWKGSTMCGQCVAITFPACFRLIRDVEGRLFVAVAQVGSLIEPPLVLGDDEDAPAEYYEAVHL